MKQFIFNAGKRQFDKNLMLSLAILADMHRYATLTHDNTFRWPGSEKIIMYSYTFEVDDESLLLLRLTHGHRFDKFMTELKVTQRDK